MDDLGCVVKFKKLRPDARTPTRGTAGAVGYDLHALLEEDLAVFPNRDPVLISTGIAVEVPPLWECQVRLRSGMGKRGFCIPNAPGTIDSDYRGEVFVMLVNITDAMIVIRPGDRIAQLVFKRAPAIHLVEVDELSATDRGAGGFGSTGR